MGSMDLVRRIIPVSRPCSPVEVTGTIVTHDELINVWKRAYKAGGHDVKFACHDHDDEDV